MFISIFLIPLVFVIAVVIRRRINYVDSESESDSNSYQYQGYDTSDESDTDDQGTSTTSHRSVTEWIDVSSHALYNITESENIEHEDMDDASTTNVVEN